MLPRSAAMLCVGLLPGVLTAQSIHGNVVTRGDSAVVSGAVVLLVNGGDSVVARALTNDRGEYRVIAPSAGTYRLRTLRIGFRPMVSEPIALSAAEDVTRRLSFSGSPFQMDTVRVIGANACRGRADSSMTPFGVWDQIRTALTAAQVSAADRSLASTVVRFDRVIDPVRDKVIKQTARLQIQFAPRPWVALPLDSLRRVGYVVTDTSGDVTYYAPDLDVLASDEFIADHCFRIVAATDTAMLGLAFEPTPERGRVPEIRGTIWLSRRTSELRDMEYRYVNIARAKADGRAGGSMSFVRLPTGAWMISRWDIRMPVQETHVRGGFAGTPGITDVRLIEIHVSGGALALVRRGRDTLFTGEPFATTGMVTDSVSGRAIAGARVTLAGTLRETVTDGEGRFHLVRVIPGNYELAVRTASLDSLGTAVRLAITLIDESTSPTIHLPSAEQVAMLLCGNVRVGLVAGSARLRGDSIPPGRVDVTVEWPDSVAGRFHALKSRMDNTGGFRVCGVPLHTPLVIRLTGDSIAAERAERVIAAGLFTRADVVVDRHVSRGALLTGVVLTDSTRTPIGDVEVVIPTLGLNTRTNARGEFRLGDIPAGAHSVVARRFGYGPLAAMVSFAANEVVERKIFLTRIAMLDTKTVTGRSVPRGRGLDAFEERRLLGLGKFMDSTYLRTNESRRFGDLLAGLSGVRLVTPPLCSANGLVSPRCVTSSTAQVAFNGRGRGCAMQVLVDGATVYRAREEDREWANMFDVNNFLSVSSLAAVEVYRSVAEAPPEYAGQAAVCGVLLLWTRRGG